MAITDEELSAVKELAGELLIKAFRGEISLAQGLTELETLTAADLVPEGADEPDEPETPDEPEQPETPDEPEQPEPPAADQPETPDEPEFVPDEALAAELDDVLADLLPGR